MIILENGVDKELLTTSVLMMVIAILVGFVTSFIGTIYKQYIYPSILSDGDTGFIVLIFSCICLDIFCELTKPLYYFIKNKYLATDIK